MTLAENARPSGELVVAVRKSTLGTLSLGLHLFGGDQQLLAGGRGQQASRSPVNQLGNERFLQSPSRRRIVE